MNRGWVLFGVTLACLLAATALLVSVAVRRIQGTAEEAVPGESLYREVMGRVVREHVGPTDAGQAVYGAMKGLVSDLDPHSRVFDPAEWAAFQMESRGEITGLGVEVVTLDGASIIAWVAPRSPAERAGVRAGDRIVAIAGRPLGPDRNAAVGALRGAVGSRVDLLLADHAGGPERRVQVSRETFSVSTVQVRLLANAVAYARVSAFRPATAKDFEEAMRAAPLRQVKGVILDLRFNRGGSFEPAVAMADAWLSDGIIVRTQGPMREDVKRATPEALLKGLPTVVLVNALTASAAEIVAGALQDTQCALLVGERTYGKGVVQDVFEFESWPGGMKLSTARYYTPAGRCIDRGVVARAGTTAAWGILPDVVVALPALDAARIERMLEREAFPAWLQAALAEKDGGAPSGDPQLETALAVLGGRAGDRSTGDADSASPR